MALVADVLPPRRDTPPDLLVRAAGPGRIRGIATDLLGRALAHPDGADGILRRGLRRARALHSRERRLVADGLAGVLRHRTLLARAAGRDDPDALWLAWLVASGLPPDGLGEPAFARAADLEALLPTDPVARLALLAGVSEPVAEELRASTPDPLAFLAASNRRAPVVIRANGDRARLAADLGATGIGSRPTRWAPRGLVLDGRPPLRGRRWRGRFAFQDEASQLCVELVDPSGPVIDWCAGAGGKTLAIGTRWPGVGLLACDVRPDALARLTHRARAARVAVRTHLLDGTPPPVAAAATVLVDAPCSGTGVWRRHPAYRLRATPDRLAALGATQRALLQRAAGHVRPGGRLIYSTCSVLRREDEEVVADFLAAHPTFRLVPAPGIADVPGPGPFLRLWPQDHGTDGFFAAVLVRRAAPA